MHVQIEALAAAAGLSVTTSAYGRGGTGQVNQLAFYDAFARHRHPRLIVLVFHYNDYWDNSRPLMALARFADPNRLPLMTAERTEDGKFRLRPPAYPDHVGMARRLAVAPRANSYRLYGLGLTSRSARWSYLGAWLHAKARVLLPQDARPHPAMVAWAEQLRRHVKEDELLDSWLASAMPRVNGPFELDPLPVPYARALEATAFGLERFQDRAKRDGATLVVLATHHEVPDTPSFDRMHAMAGDLNIPVVSLYGHIVGRGGQPADANWPHDGHWNPAGHRMAAQALVDWLRRHPEACAPNARATA